MFRSVGNGSHEHVQELQGWGLLGDKAAALTQSGVSQPCKRQAFLGFQTMHESLTRRSAAARERPSMGKANGTVLLEGDVCAF